MLECAIAEAKLRQLIETPLVSIVVPTYGGSSELVLSVSSVADQLVGGLEHKVEIIITDNASGPDTVAQIKHMAAQYPTVSYLLHKRDEGSFFQMFAAPWRARGRYTWVFSANDLLLPGGIAHVIALLEREAPSCAWLNKKVFSNDLSHEVPDATNLAPDRRFERFEDLMAALGVRQLSSVSASIEATEAARALDPQPYLRADTRRPHVAALLRKHMGKPACYASEPFLVHRSNEFLASSRVLDNAFDLAVTLPALLDAILRQGGAPGDFLERMTGARRIEDFGPPKVTHVDLIFENLLRAMGGGRYFTVSQRWTLEAILAGCRLGRLQQLADIWNMQDSLRTLEERADEAKAMLQQGREACLQASRTFSGTDSGN